MSDIGTSEPAEPAVLAPEPDVIPEAPPAVAPDPLPETAPITDKRDAAYYAAEAARVWAEN